MSKTIAKVWTFSSSSNKNKTYETLQYDDNTTSCNCPGWTRRVAADGSRTCKHTRLVDQGIADQECVSSHEYTQPAPISVPQPYGNTLTTAFRMKSGSKSDKVKSKPATTPAVPRRKIRWQ